MPLPPGKVAPMDVFNFTLSFAKKSARRSFAPTRREAEQIKRQELVLSPEAAGVWANRINLQGQLSKTHQRRFIDLFA